MVRFLGLMLIVELPLMLAAHNTAVLLSAFISKYLHLFTLHIVSLQNTLPCVKYRGSIFSNMNRDNNQDYGSNISSLMRNMKLT